MQGDSLNEKVALDTPSPPPPPHTHTLYLLIKVALAVRLTQDIPNTGSATIRATQWIINAPYNQSQRFFHLSPEPRML
jgi:hypothetical protein